MKAYKYDPYQPTKVLETSTDASQVMDREVCAGQKHGTVQSTAGIPDRPILSASIFYPPPPSDPNLSPEGSSIAPARLAPFPHENANQEAIAPVIFLRKDQLVRDKYIVQGKWEGTVIEVKGDSFLAHLIDQDGIHSNEEAEFPIDEVPIPDRSLIEPGAVFYWSIGYIDKISGQRMRVSDIRFRRLPMWNSEELERAKKNATRFRNLLNWK